MMLLEDKLQLIPLTPIPHQQFSIVLDGQNCVITLRQMGNGLYASGTIDQVDVFSEQLCNNRIPVPAFKTNDFSGHLVFVDTHGSEHPRYDELGSRFKLYYLSEGEEWQA